jgi:hypothetical protein
VAPKSARKTDYLKQAAANDDTGRLGEEFALAYEKFRLKDYPDLLRQLRHVSKEDDSLGYDIESRELDGSPRFVEVKGTFGPLETRFFLSSNEIDCAEKNGKSYVILRVSLNGKETKCCEIRPPLDEQLDLTPTTYSVKFKAK